MSPVSSMALALLFAGQGAQKVGMGKSLYAQSAAARALYDEANAVLGWDLLVAAAAGHPAVVRRFAQHLRWIERGTGAVLVAIAAGIAVHALA